MEKTVVSICTSNDWSFKLEASTGGFSVYLYSLRTCDEENVSQSRCEVAMRAQSRQDLPKVAGTQPGDKLTPGSETKRSAFLG